MRKEGDGILATLEKASFLYHFLLSQITDKNLLAGAMMLSMTQSSVFKGGSTLHGLKFLGLMCSSMRRMSASLVHNCTVHETRKISVMRTTRPSDYGVVTGYTAKLSGLALVPAL